ncbi:MAG: DUF1036 domain-containing protein [Synergistaceae bacterium]|nr:DUF1036 domain-containing protein [Synergistaceae bacterium]
MKRLVLILAALAAFTALPPSQAQAYSYYITLRNDTNMEVNFALGLKVPSWDALMRGWWSVPPNSSREVYHEYGGDIKFVYWIAETKGAAWYGRESETIFEVVPEKFEYKTDISEKDNRGTHSPKNKNGIRMVPFRKAPMSRGRCTIRVTM